MTNDPCSEHMQFDMHTRAHRQLKIKIDRFEYFIYVKKLGSHHCPVIKVKANTFTLVFPTTFLKSVHYKRSQGSCFFVMRLVCLLLP